MGARPRLSSYISTIVVLAAGQGTRMKSEVPKVLHAVAGVAMVNHVLRAAEQINAGNVVVVLGHGHKQVEPHLPKGCTVVLQEEQRGTGHALLMASKEVGEGPVLVLSGDTPLLTGHMLREFTDAHFSCGSDASVATMQLDDPTGYGRVIRSPGGEVRRIVEQEEGVHAFRAPDPEEFMGVNTRVDLADAQSAMRDRICRDWMLAGVTILDPHSTHIDAAVKLAPDVTLMPNTVLRGDTRVGRGSEIGPGCTLVDTVVGEDCLVLHSYSQRAVLGNCVKVGPFAYLRPEAQLEDGVKVGTFVEIKKSRLGTGSKVPHLSYIGDAEIGAGTNIGAGNITANYDGREKHRTVIGEQVNTGSDTVFVAPVEIGDNVTIGAGSVITKDVPVGALGIARARQKNIPGYAVRLRPHQRAEDNEG